MPTMPLPAFARMLTAFSLAILPACASSPGRPPRPAPDPVIERRVETVILCPDELRAPLPPAVALPDGAILRGNAEGLGFVNRRFRREELLESRLQDAAEQCP